LPDYFCARSSLKDVSDILIALSSQELIELESIGDVRHRSIAKFNVFFHVLKFPEIERVSAGAFVQQSASKADLRAVPRFYSEVSDELVNHSGLRQLLRFVSLLTRGIRKTTHKLQITLHQVSVSALAGEAFVSPEGIHQLGVDYLVSAIPLSDEKVAQPLTSVYDASEKLLLKTRLKVGEGLFHDDKLYKHSLSPLQATANQGRRCLLGFDIKVLD
jgi:hypothetical protein